MTEPADSRVAVYIDFDNIVISRYDQVHGRGQYMRDKPKGSGGSGRVSEAELAERLEQATVDVGAIIDFASSFGTLVLTRAYADWSVPVNAGYRHQLVGRAVDLVQLFPAAAYSKNGADIRLAVDAIEDMFRLPDLTHVIVVGGDSDYIALAQRCKRLGRYVVGIGVAGSTSRALASACDDFASYDALPGIKPIPPRAPKEASAPEGSGPASETGTRSSGGRRRSGSSGTAKADSGESTGATAVESGEAVDGSDAKPGADSGAETKPASRSRGSRGSGRGKAATQGGEAIEAAEVAVGAADTDEAAVEKAALAALLDELPAAPASQPEASAPGKRVPRRARSSDLIVVRDEDLDDLEPLHDDDEDADDEEESEDSQEIASGLLERALRLGHEKDDAEWLHSSNVKTQMKRMDPSFSERSLGFRSFSDFIKSREDIAELDESSTARLVRLAPALAAQD